MWGQSTYIRWTFVKLDYFDFPGYQTTLHGGSIELSRGNKIGHSQARVTHLKPRGIALQPHLQSHGHGQLGVISGHHDPH